jgi:O-antigen/teichoic acid export membrane protein
MFIHVAAVKTQDSEDITQISKQVFKWILIITMPLFIAILLFPSDILSNLFHKAYIKDLDITRLLAISYFLQSISWMAERILIAKNKKVFRVVSNYFFGSVFVILSLFFAYLSFGLMGIAIAYLISSVIDAFSKYILVVWKTKVSFIGMEHMKIFAVGALGGLVTYILFFNRSLLFLPFFFILYFAILWIVGVVNHKTIFDFKKLVVKEVGIGEYND